MRYANEEAERVRMCSLNELAINKSLEALLGVGASYANVSPPIFDRQEEREQREKREKKKEKKEKKEKKVKAKEKKKPRLTSRGL